MWYLWKLKVLEAGRLQHGYNLETGAAGKCGRRILNVLCSIEKQRVVFTQSQTMTNECTMQTVEIKVPFIIRYITPPKF